MNKLYLLGTFQLEKDGEPCLGFESEKAMALLAYVVLQNRPIPRPTLAALFWPDFDSKRANGNLRRVLTNLRGLIGDCLAIERRTVAWVGGCWVDVVAFQKPSPPDPLSQRLEGEQNIATAVALYRGELLQGIRAGGSAEFELWLIGERERYQQRFVSLLDQLIAEHEQRGDYALALGYAQRMVRTVAWREEAHCAVMRLLARLGRRSDALHQYEQCKRILQEELAVTPTWTTERLAQRIANPLKTVGLPQSLTSFIGRSDTLTHLSNLLHSRDHHLITLTGMGGVGKTRIACEVARHVQPRFLDGVWFVDLAHASDLLTALAQSHDITGGANAPLLAQVIGSLRGRESLLILDNFEGVTDSAPIITTLLQAAPDLKLLVTSRERLNLVGEMVVPLGGLGDDATQLFIETARRVRGDFSADNALISDICQLVEGHPLAIELAANWVRSLDLATIRQEIVQSLTFLESQQHNRPQRHQSSAAVFASSWRLLDGEARRVLAALSLLRGTFDRKAALAVGDTRLSQLADLIDKSLLRFDGRYSLHPLIREFANERIAKREVVQERHGRYFLRRAVLDEAGLSSADHTKVVADYDNIAAAWAWAIAAGRPELLQAAFPSLYIVFDYNQLRPNAVFRLAELAWPSAQRWAQTDDATAIRLALDLCAVIIAYRLSFGQFAELPALLHAAYSLLARCDDNADDFALTLSNLAFSLYFLGEVDSADQLANRLLESDSRSFLRAVAIDQLSLAHLLRADYARAKALSAAAQTHWQTPTILHNAGLIHEAMGDVDSAERCYRQGLQSTKAHSASFAERLGIVALMRGELESAEKHLRASLHDYERLNSYDGRVMVLVVLGYVRAMRGAISEGLQLSDDGLQLLQGEQSFLHAYAQSWRARTLVVAGKLDAAQQMAQAGKAAAKLAAFPFLVQECVATLGEIALARGEQERGIEILQAVAVNKTAHALTTQRAETLLGHEGT